MRGAEGAPRAVTLFSLTGSRMLHGIDDEAYLRHLFRELPPHPMSRIDEWPPLAWAVCQKAAAN